MTDFWVNCPFNLNVVIWNWMSDSLVKNLLFERCLWSRITQIHIKPQARFLMCVSAKALSFNFNQLFLFTSVLQDDCCMYSLNVFFASRFSSPLGLVRPRCKVTQIPAFPETLSKTRQTFGAVKRPTYKKKRKKINSFSVASLRYASRLLVAIWKASFLPSRL